MKWRRYLRWPDGSPWGMVIVDERGNYGWSVCATADRFEYARARKISEGRLAKRSDNRMLNGPSWACPDWKRAPGWAQAAVMATVMEDQMWQQQREEAHDGTGTLPGDVGPAQS